jgi:molybdopterin synthase sulfur carrier subunit
MRVTVRYHSLFRRRIGAGTGEIELPEGASARDALLALAQRHGDAAHALLLEADGEIARDLVIFHNDRLLRLDERGRTLANGDELALFPALGGG